MRSWVCPVIVGLAACAGVVPIDEALYRQHLQREYARTPAECFAATRQALVDVGIGVHTSDPATRSIVSARGAFAGEEVKTRLTPGRTSMNTEYRNEVNLTTGKWERTPQTVYSQAPDRVDAYAISFSGYQEFHFVVDETPGGCRLRVTRWRVWQDGRELNEIVLPYTQKNLWEPVYNEISSRLGYGRY